MSRHISSLLLYLSAKQLRRGLVIILQQWGKWGCTVRVNYHPVSPKRPSDQGVLLCLMCVLTCVCVRRSVGRRQPPGVLISPVSYQPCQGKRPSVELSVPDKRCSPDHYHHSFGCSGVSVVLIQVPQTMKNEKKQTKKRLSQHCITALMWGKYPVE